MLNLLSFNDTNNYRARLEAQEINNIKNMYRELSADVRRRAQKIPTTTMSNRMRRNYLNGLAKEIKKEIESINKNVKGSVEFQMKEVANAVFNENRNLASSLGMKVSYKISNVPTDIVNKVMSGKLYEEKWSLSSAIWGDNKRKRQDINTIIAKGIAENKSAYDIAKDLETYVNPSAAKGWEWSKVYPNTLKVIDYNAQRLARTMVTHAYQESLITAAKANPFVEAIKWETANNHRVCPLCRDLEEDDHYGMGPGIFPKDKVPLDHPMGQCTLMYVLHEIDDIVDRLADWVNGANDPELDLYSEYF